MKKEEIEDEFERIAYILTSQGDTDVLCDLIQFEAKKEFVDSWKSGC